MRGRGRRAPGEGRRGRKEPMKAQRKD